jgi:hypothetical protein
VRYFPIVFGGYFGPETRIADALNIERPTEPTAGLTQAVMTVFVTSPENHSDLGRMCGGRVSPAGAAERGPEEHGRGYHR